MRNFTLTLPIVILITAQNSTVCAFEVSTHELLNQRAAEQSTKVGTYLRTHLGLDQGLAHPTVADKTILDLIGSGGILEDAGWFFNGRYYNHFHNPLKSWPAAGLHDSILGVNLTGESSILWAHRPAGTQQNRGNWSWFDVRNAFYGALTGTTPSARDGALADTFRGVGQLMHLVEDVSVPAHTRNDAHIRYNYEQWARDHQDSLDTNPVRPSLALDTAPAGLVPIAQLWDTDRYDGTGPLAGTDIGLAEYANANFLSNDTLFVDDPVDRRSFPFPSRANTEPWTDTVDGRRREYLRKTGPGEPVEHLATLSALDRYVRVFFPDFADHLAVGLDDRVYEDQAEKLVPRAVGYAMALLEYFFRVDLEATSTGPDTATITNRGPEPMDGTFELYYDATNGTRARVAGASWPLALAVGATSPDLTVTPPTDAAEPGRYTLVFRGRVGGEADAAGGRVVTLGQPNVLIVQDTLEVVARLPVEQATDSPEYRYCPDQDPDGQLVCIMAIEWREQSWEHVEQASGRFGASRAANAFVSISLCPTLSAGHFFINDVAIPVAADCHTWTPGMTADTPSRWRAEGLVAGRSVTPSSRIEIRLADGTRVRQNLVLGKATQHTSSRCSQWFVNDVDPVAPGEGRLEAWSAVQMGRGTVDVIEPDGTHLVFSTPFAVDGEYNVATETAPCGIPEPMPLLPYPPFPAAPTIQRVYSAEELAWLAGRSLSPQPYAISVVTRFEP